MTAVLVVSCLVSAGLFLVVAAWMQGQSFRRAARANAAAAAFCAVGGLVLPFAGRLLPTAVLALATLLGATSMHAVRAGRG